MNFNDTILSPKAYCPQSGKIYLIIFMSILFTCLLTSISKVTNEPENSSIINDLTKTGIAVNVVSFAYTLHLLKIDIFDSCKTLSKQNCKNGCKWYGLSPFSFEHNCKKVFMDGSIYALIFLLCSIYLLVFGIEIITNTQDQKHEKELTKVSIASIIVGVIGILFTITDFLIC